MDEIIKSEEEGAEGELLLPGLDIFSSQFDDEDDDLPEREEELPAAAEAYAQADKDKSPPSRNNAAADGGQEDDCPLMDIDYVPSISDMERDKRAFRKFMDNRRESKPAAEKKREKKEPTFTDKGKKLRKADGGAELSLSAQAEQKSDGLTCDREPAKKKERVRQKARLKLEKKAKPAPSYRMTDKRKEHFASLRAREDAGKTADLTYSISKAEQKLLFDAHSDRREGYKDLAFRQIARPCAKDRGSVFFDAASEGKTCGKMGSFFLGMDSDRKLDALESLMSEEKKGRKKWTL